MAWLQCYTDYMEMSLIKSETKRLDKLDMLWLCFEMKKCFSDYKNSWENDRRIILKTIDYCREREKQILFGKNW